MDFPNAQIFPVTLLPPLVHPDVLENRNATHTRFLFGMVMFGCLDWTPVYPAPFSCSAKVSIERMYV